MQKVSSKTFPRVLNKDVSQGPKHWVKSVYIRSFSGPYSVRKRENTDQKSSEYGHFSHSESYHWV